jgi:hypothetical protein
MKQLPSSADSKLGALIDSASEAQAVVNSTLDRIRELEHGIYNNPNGDRAKEWGQELTRLTARRSAQQARFASLSTTVTAIKTWLAGLPANIVFEAVEPPALALKDGETITEAVERIRGEIAATQRELTRVRNAALPVETIKQQAEAYVTSLVERGRPSIHCGHDTAFTASIPSHGWTVKSPVLELLAWVDPQKLLQRLHAQIEADATATDQLRLTAVERGELLAAMAAVLDDLERTEEALIERASDTGQLIERRHDASSAAILGVKAAKRKAKVAA